MKNLNLKIKNNSWDICKYAYEDCEEAKDIKYFNKYCLNRGEDCPIKPLELSNKLELNLS